MFVVTLLIGCGGGGGGGTDGGLAAGRWMTVNVESNTEAATTTTYTGDYTGNGTTTPLLIGYVFSGGTTTETIVEMVTSAVEVEVAANSIDAGTYSATPGSLLPTGIRYSLNGTNIYVPVSGTVTLTNVGAVGAPITGSFDAIVSNTTDTKRVWGSFSINRFN